MNLALPSICDRERLFQSLDLPVPFLMVTKPSSHTQVILPSWQIPPTGLWPYWKWRHCCPGHRSLRRVFAFRTLHPVFFTLSRTTLFTLVILFSGCEYRSFRDGPLQYWSELRYHIEKAQPWNAESPLWQFPVQPEFHGRIFIQIQRKAVRWYLWKHCSNIPSEVVKPTSCNRCFYNMEINLVIELSKGWFRLRNMNSKRFPRRIAYPHSMSGNVSKVFFTCCGILNPGAAFTSMMVASFSAVGLNFSP